MPKTMSFPSEQNRSVQLESPTRQKGEKEDSRYSDWSEVRPQHLLHDKGKMTFCMEAPVNSGLGVSWNRNQQKWSFS